MPNQAAWQPTETFKRDAKLSHYMAWLRETRGLDFADYDALWRWSVNDLEAF